jgi:hypothetical protein
VAEQDVEKLTEEREFKLAAVIASTKGGNPLMQHAATTSGAEGDDYVPEEAAGNVQGDNVFPIIGASTEMLSGALEPITAAEKRAMERRSRMDVEDEDGSAPAAHSEPAPVPEPEPEPEPEPVPVAPVAIKKKKKLPQNFMTM